MAELQSFGSQDMGLVNTKWRGGKRKSSPKYLCCEQDMNYCIGYKHTHNYSDAHRPVQSILTRSTDVKSHSLCLPVRTTPWQKPQGIASPLSTYLEEHRNSRNTQSYRTISSAKLKTTISPNQPNIMHYRITTKGHRQKWFSQSQNNEITE